MNRYIQLTRVQQPDEDPRVVGEIQVDRYRITFVQQRVGSTYIHFTKDDGIHVSEGAHLILKRLKEMEQYYAC